MIANQLLHYRCQKDLSQHQLAQRAGVTASTIQRIERGRHAAQPRTQYRLAGALGVPVRDVFPQAA